MYIVRTRWMSSAKQNCPNCNKNRIYFFHFVHLFRRFFLSLSLSPFFALFIKFILNGTASEFMAFTFMAFKQRYVLLVGLLLASMVCRWWSLISFGRCALCLCFFYFLPFLFLFCFVFVGCWNAVAATLFSYSVDYCQYTYWAHFCNNHHRTRVFLPDERFLFFPVPWLDLLWILSTLKIACFHFTLPCEYFSTWHI